MATAKRSAAAKKAAKTNTKTKPAVKKKPALKKPAPKAPARKPEPLKTVVVTGAAGFVGSHMVEEMLDAGYRVIATDQPGSNLSGAQKAGAECVPADFTDAAALHDVFKSKVHYVIHVAALYDFAATRSDLMKVNKHGTRNVAEAALQSGVEHFFYFSTGDIHGQVDIPIYETTPVAPINAYAESKWEGENIIRGLGESRGLPFSVIRPTVIYGPRSRYVASNLFCVPGIVRAISDKIKLSRRDLNVFMGGPIVSWVHVRDITGSVRYLLGRKEAFGEAYNVADVDPMTLSEFFELVFEVFGFNWIPTAPYPTLIIAGAARVGMNMPEWIFEIVTRFMQKNWEAVRDKYGLTDDIRPRFSRDFLTFMLGNRIYDSSKLRAAGYDMRYPDTRAGLRETLVWYRDNRWLPNPGGEE